MTNAEHEQLHRDLGVYVLGGLGPAQRDRFERHLAACRSCREELADLAVLPQLLGRMDETSGDESDAAPLLQPVLARIARARARDRRRQRLLVGTAVASLAVTVVLAALVLAPGLRGALGPGAGGDLGEPRGPEPTFVAVEGEASAWLEPRPWGMVAHIEATDLTDELGYSAWAVTDSGHRAQLASWSSSEGTVALVGSCYLQPEEVATVEIVGASDDEVLRVLQRRS